MSPSMSCETPLRFVSFLTLVALEWFLHHVRSRVSFQNARFDGCIVALVTFERPLSCVLLHHVIFQLTSCDASSCAFAGCLILLFCTYIDCN